MVGIGDTIMLLGEIPFTPRAKKVLEFSVEESQLLNSEYIGTEHILLGLIREEEGMAGAPQIVLATVIVNRLSKIVKL